MHGNRVDIVSVHIYSSSFRLPFKELRNSFRVPIETLHHREEERAGPSVRDGYQVSHFNGDKISVVRS